MANRPLYIPREQPTPHVETVTVEFTWFPGFAKVQAQRSIASLHKAAASVGIEPVLEISSKSPDSKGVAMSAFNLRLDADFDRNLTVECAFQGSKVFQKGGPYEDLYGATSREAKRDPRLRSSGPLVGFSFLGISYPLEPKTAFYDWLYARALINSREDFEYALEFDGFTDIAFNPKKSLNCQAGAAAAVVAQHRAGSTLPDAGDFEQWSQLLTHPSTQTSPGRENQGQLF